MELNEFLVKAKVNTYATSGEGGERILEDGSKELVYEEGGFKYRDRYFGFGPFAGEEIVWKDGRPFWAMNYYGSPVSGAVPAEKFYEFLKRALRKVTREKPFRGPDNFKEGDFEYINESEGGVGDFAGIEMILCRGEEVYKLSYHGGFIKTKLEPVGT